MNGPIWHSKASQIAARVLQSMFCDKGVCKPEAVEPLLADARPDREAETQAPQASGRTAEI